MKQCYLLHEQSDTNNWSQEVYMISTTKWSNTAKLHFGNPVCVTIHVHVHVVLNSHSYLSKYTCTCTCTYVCTYNMHVHLV